MGGTMSIVMVGSTSGSITLQEPAIAGSTTINLPATSGTALVAPTALTVPNTTGTVMVSGNMPAFSAYLTGSQSVSNGVYTKIQMNTEEWDTANCYDPSTNYRFTPNVAGYYFITATVSPSGSSPSSAVPAIYKNGSVYKYGPYIQTTNANSTVNCIVYMNGSTDYVECYAYQTASTNSWGNGSTSTYWQGYLARAA